MVSTHGFPYHGRMFGTFISIVIAVVAGYVILRLGFSIFRLLATPLPEPPPAGELRKVKLNFRCSTCGSEVREYCVKNVACYVHFFSLLFE